MLNKQSVILLIQFHIMRDAFFKESLYFIIICLFINQSQVCYYSSRIGINNKKRPFKGVQKNRIRSFWAYTF